MVSILQFLESIPSDLLEPIELKDGAMILDHYMLTMYYDGKNKGTIVITPYANEIRIEFRPNTVMIIRGLSFSFSEMRKRLENYFNILGLSVSVYYRNPYKTDSNPYGVLI